MRALTAWFDTKRPNILCIDLEKFLSAFRLWVDHYLKRSDACCSWYFYDDPGHKEEMVRMVLAPPMAESLPSKAVLIAPRGTGKTVTLFVELFSFVAICRPNTVLVMSQIIDTLTQEKIDSLRIMIEDNEVIQEDFGGRGELWPAARTGKKWNSSALYFPCSKSIIRGVSIGSKHRGRHPDLGLIDDPDDENLGLDPLWRQRFFNWLLRTYVPMFSRGGHICLMQTACHGMTPAYTMIRSQTDEIDWEVIKEATDTQFETSFYDWRKKIFALHVEDPMTGVVSSLWEAKYPAAQRFQLEASLTTPVYLAEMQGHPIAGGSFIFHRHPITHGFMICRDYVIDLPTGRIWSHKEFLGRLRVVVAADPSTGSTIDSDPAAAVVVGMDPAGAIFVLDVFNKVVPPETLVKTVMWDMSLRWGCERAAWEKQGYQILIQKMAELEATKMRERGLNPPHCISITGSSAIKLTAMTRNKGREKTGRIIGTLKPTFLECRIRFRAFGEVALGEGDARVTHVAMADPGEREGHHIMLREQIDSFTDMGGKGVDDAIDALEMAVRTAWRLRGSETEDPDDPNEAELAAWADAGVEWNQSTLPRTVWTKEHLAEHNDRIAKVIGAVSSEDVPEGSDASYTSDCDPYGVFD